MRMFFREIFQPHQDQNANQWLPTWLYGAETIALLMGTMDAVVDWGWRGGLDRMKLIAGNVQTLPDNLVKPLGMSCDNSLALTMHNLV